MTIFVCGFMGCGKTRLGRVLAQLLHLPLIDLDDYIVQQEGRSIPEIFAENGEPYFRAVEAQAVRTLRHQNAVISCGGGAMLNAESAAAARETGAVVLLDQSFAVCYSRIKNDTNRPLVQRNTKEQLETIYHQRDSVYRAHANYIVPAGNTPEESAQRVLDALGLSAVTEETK